MNRVLIIDEDPSLAHIVAGRLFDEGIQAEIYQNGEIALDRLSRSVPIDLVLLGSAHPHVDSVALYRRLRRELTCPILYIHDSNHDIRTRLMPEIDRDDFFVKPLAVEELFARVERHLHKDALHPDDGIQHIDSLSIDRRKKRAYFNGQTIRLSAREFQLLCFLADRLGETVTREQIIAALWAVGDQSVANVTVHIKNLRGKFDPDSRFIKTVWGVGYKLTNPSGVS